MDVAIHQNSSDPEHLLQFVWGTSAATALVGHIFRGGASTGGGVIETEAVIATSMNRDGYIDTDSSDAQSGIALWYADNDYLTGLFRYLSRHSLSRILTKRKPSFLRKNMGN